MLDNNEALGRVVYAKAGRDKGKPFVVVRCAFENEGEYYYLADGKTRKIEAPKKKKLKHVQPTNFKADFICAKLEGGNKDQTLDAELRKVLMQFANSKGGHELVKG